MGIGAVSGKGALNYGLDFKGGTSTNVTFNEDLSLEEISSKVVPVVAEVSGDSEVQTQKVAGTTEVIIKTKTLSVEQRQALGGVTTYTYDELGNVTKTVTPGKVETAVEYGSAARNQKLSEARAKAVYDYLISQGVDAKQLDYKGLGSTVEPFSSPATNRVTITE